MTSPPSHTKVTRQNWIDGALTALTGVPIDQLRILTLASALDVSRSSFYWYFENLDELQAELLAIWEDNTESIMERSRREAKSMVAAILGVFECWADPNLYDSSLDLAVRDWGRRDDVIARRVAEADDVRLAALAEMFARNGFESDDAVVRARLLYHSQVGYYAVRTDEPYDVRLAYLPYYLEVLSTATPTERELADFRTFISAVDDRSRFGRAERHS